ncbi:MAG TPA: amidohydrolase family protein, partial [Pirellulales bacterium]|nr:amidohydrolase family protein [Pirellulales bacterium]
LERAVTRLKLKGAVINSHTRGEYLDDRKFWPIFEAAEALDVPVYNHPNTLPADMIGPLLSCAASTAPFTDLPLNAACIF